MGGRSLEPIRDGMAAAVAARDEAAALIRALNERIDRALEPLIPADRPYALVDFPDTSNVGDSAIWLGELAWLRRHGLGAPVYTCSNQSFSPRTMRRRLPGDATILVSGGGNFGDLYRVHQRLRETIVRKFPDHKIVQMPQSIQFDAPAAVEETRRIFDDHPDLTIVVRDKPSLQFAEATFRAPRRLCPDMALCLGPCDREAPPTRDIVWLARRDRETVQQAVRVLPAGVKRLDWLKDDETRLFRYNRLLRHLVRRWPRYRNWLQAPLSHTYEALARQRVRRGLRILGEGRTVITDRLHGHILTLLLGIPHVVLDNSYGKIRRFHEAWTQGTSLVRWCDDPETALRLARQPWPLVSD